MLLTTLTTLDRNIDLLDSSAVRSKLYSSATDSNNNSINGESIFS